MIQGVVKWDKLPLRPPLHTPKQPLSAAELTWVVMVVVLLLL
jgi:hypothetical protein